MKKAISSLIVMAFLFAMPVVLVSQTPPHPNGGNGPSGGNTPVGGGAPIDGGLSFMLILGAAYGSKKIYKAFK